MACSTNNKKTTDVVTNVHRSLTERLHSAFTITCEKFMSYIKFSKMKENFRAIYNENPEALKVVHNQLCSQMKKSITEDLDELSKEHCVDYLLNSLEEIKKKQETSQQSWRPSGDPQEDLRDHIYPLKLKQEEDLQAVLTKLQLSNEELINEISINHGEILHIKKCNDDLHEEVSNLITSFTGTNLENVQEVLKNALEDDDEDA